MTEQTDLFKDFPAITKAEWLQKVIKDLKGRPLEALQWSLGNKKIDPFLMEVDFDVPPTPLTTSGHTGNTWEISEDIDAGANTNAVTLEALAGGVNAPRWIVDTPGTDEKLSEWLRDIHPGMISMHFQLREGGGDVFRFRDGLLKWLDQSERHSLRGSLQTPPMSQSDRHDWMREGLQILPAYTWLTIDGTPYFTADIQQKALGLANIVADAARILAFEEAQGTDIALLSRSAQLLTGVGSDYFVEIAAIRALKLLWGNMISGFGITNPEPPLIWAITAPAEMKDDTYSNMIIATSQAMSAAIAGAARITVTPADALAGPPGAFSKRIARNVQHLLALESHLDKVQDPAAGAYYIEQLTDILAEQAWEIFQSLSS